jgi:hypothetical protein
LNAELVVLVRQEELMERMKLELHYGRVQEGGGGKQVAELELTEPVAEAQLVVRYYQRSNL